jgi:signal transduction histidine kinase
MSYADPNGAPRTEEELLIAVIHDVRRHLRTAVARTQMLERELTVPVTPALRTHLDEIVGAGRDMDALLSRLAIYALAASSREEGNQPRGDISVMFDSALRRLSHKNKDAEIDSTRLQNCGIQAPYAIESVLRELLDNALTFRHGPVKITVLVEQASESTAFGIRDTGIGFDEPRYHEMIMRPLERLHPQSVYGGCGMGLAICQRTIEAFGGTLWAQSKSNEGSTFWFSLPL